MESVPSVFPDQPSPERLIKKDATVMVSPSIGGGTGRYMHSTPNGAMIDIKGVARELSEEEFSLPQRDYEDPYQKGNDWFHASTEPDTIGRMNDKPEFRPGDMVKVADVYGSVIGPGFGVFIAYGTTGEDCIISFDNKEIVVPTANVGAVLEQNAKDNFDEMDNDGNLSPMSLGSDNVKVEQPATGMSKQEPAMDQRDEFSKWIDTVEEALANENAGALDINMLPTEQPGQCGCGSWQCPVCFPEQGELAAQQDTCSSCGQPVDGHNHNDADAMGFVTVDNSMDDGLDDMTDLVAVDEEPMDFEVEPERPRSGGGVKLGDIVQTTTFKKSGGNDSPLTYGEENLGEGDWYNPDVDDMAVDSQWNDSDVGFGDQQEDHEKSELIKSITYMQDLGFSKSGKRFSSDELNAMSADQLHQVSDLVMGDVAEDADMMDGSMGEGPSAGGGASGGAHYAPGTAPTMPESIQKGNMTMENVDKDISTWLDRFKAYDELRASKNPVMEKKAKPDFTDVDKDGDKKESWKKAEKDKEAMCEEDEKNPWEKLASDKKDDKDEVGKETKTHKGGTVTKTKTGIVHKKADESVEVKENADPEVLEWMTRFSKLGNMKGYGR